MVCPSHAGRRKTLLGTALLIGMIALSARPAVGQVTTKLTPGERMDPGPTIGAGFLVGHDAERRIELVLLTHRIEDGRIVATHGSRPFRAAPGRPVRLDERHLPPERFYEGQVAGEVAPAPAPVPLESVERWAPTSWSEVLEPTFAQEWSAVRTFDTWKQRGAVLMVAIPADPRLRRDAMGYPIMVSLESPSPTRR